MGKPGRGRRRRPLRRALGCCGGASPAPLQVPDARGEPTGGPTCTRTHCRSAEAPAGVRRVGVLVSARAIHWPRPLRPLRGRRGAVRAHVARAVQPSHTSPPAPRGFDFRILNGFLYLSPGTIDDPDRIAERTAQFRTAGWLLLRALGRALRRLDGAGRALLARLDASRSLRWSMPYLSTRSSSGRGLGPSYDLTRRYHDVLDLAVGTVAVPLRVPQPRLRRLPRLLRLLPRQLPTSTIW